MNSFTSLNRVLVTGGAGFVGSNIVRRLLNEGVSVVVLDDFYTGCENNLPASHPQLKVVRGSVTDAQLVHDVMEKVDVVIHEAARNIIVSTRSPKEDCEVNIFGTLNVLLAARELRVRRVVYASSASVYGNPRHLPINEDDSINLLSPYAVSKFAGEGYCSVFYETYGVSTAVVRYSNVYGPAQRAPNPYCGVVTKIFDALIRGEAPKIHGDGNQTRDYTYVDDVVEATLTVAVSVKAENQVYNVSTGIETSVNELCRLATAIVGADVEPVYVDRRDIDNIRRRALNIEKIRKELRWVPSVSLAPGLRRTFDWLASGAAGRSATNDAVSARSPLDRGELPTSSA